MFDERHFAELQGRGILRDDCNHVGCFVHTPHLSGILEARCALRVEKASIWIGIAARIVFPSSYVYIREFLNKISSAIDVRGSDKRY